MSITYNEETLANFRKFAVTRADCLIVGNKYWSNAWRGERTIERLETTKENYAHRGMEPATCSGNFEWIRFTDGSSVSMNDNNIGASYSPWLIFGNENMANACSDMLDIVITQSTDWDYFDDY